MVLAQRRRRAEHPGGIRGCAMYRRSPWCDCATEWRREVAQNLRRGNGKQRRDIQHLYAISIAAEGQWVVNNHFCTEASICWSLVKIDTRSHNVTPACDVTQWLACNNGRRTPLIIVLQGQPDNKDETGFKRLFVPPKAIHPSPLTVHSLWATAWIQHIRSSPFSRSWVSSSFSSPCHGICKHGMQALASICSGRAFHTLFNSWILSCGATTHWMLHLYGVISVSDDLLRIQYRSFS